jgi:hypothetical protein
MKKIIRLTESDLVRLVKRIISEGERYGSFGDSGGITDSKGKSKHWVDMDTDQFSDDDINDDDFDSEEFDDYESFNEKHPKRKALNFGDDENKRMFKTYREKTGKPLTIKTRKPQKSGGDSGFDHDREFRKYQGDIGDASWS